jgi:hypothetical protein
VIDLEDQKSRINKAYAHTVGTESYERRLCVEEIESMRQLVNELKDDAERYRWLRRNCTFDLSGAPGCQAWFDFHWFSRIRATWTKPSPSTRR